MRKRMHEGHAPKTRTVSSLLVGLMVAAIALPVPSGAVNDEELDGDLVIVVGGQDDNVDAADDRDAKFDRNGEIPSGMTLDYFRYSNAEDGNFLRIQGWDASQDDERFRLRAGVGDRVRLRADYASLPYRFGSGATFVMGRGADDAWGPTYRIGDFSQMLFENPDGDGTQFFTGATETAEDNASVQAMTRDLLTGFEPMSIGSRRRRGGVGASFQPDRQWTFDIDARRETRDGTQPLGTGTYQRITDVNSDGMTDSDYFFSIRGIEMPAVIDFTTTRYDGAARYRDREWFVDLRGGYTQFENEHIGLTYDNPFWYNGTEATSGSRRGLWEEGRASYEPSNEAWDVSASGGVDLPSRTRITAGVTLGEHTQNENLLPITTNPALIGTNDINGDGTVDAMDNPTVAAIPGLVSALDGNPTLGTSLDASSNIRSYNLVVTTKPVDGLALKGRFRNYDYEGQEGIFVVPARAEYIESRIKTDFKGDQILHVPLDFSRRTIDGSASYRVTRQVKVKAFGGRKTSTYDHYVDTDDNTSRDSGSRAVASTDDDSYGATAMFAYQRWVSGRATVQQASRTFDGAYTPGFSGENKGDRQFDIANRDRTAANAAVDVMPNDRMSIGVGFRWTDDDYPDSEYGYQKGQEQGWNVNVNAMATEDLTVFAYADGSTWDMDTNLRTKCANCPDAAGIPPWGIENFDWMSEYKDESLAFGGGFTWTPTAQTDVDFGANWVRGEVEQKTANPATPVELDPANPLFGEVANVALGFDFPTQTSEYLTTELRITRELNPQVDLGLWWRYDDFQLEDFQWDDMEAYGADFLTVDDATRYLFLDSRYGDFTAHIAGLFAKVSF